MQDLRKLSDAELRDEFIAAMCSYQHEDALAVLDEIDRREEAGKAVFEPVMEV